MEPILINTKGHCFLCLDEGDSDGTQSLQNLCRYLKIDVGNILASLTFGVASFTNVKVSLCMKCDNIVSQISDHYQLLESIQVKLNDLAETVHKSIEGATAIQNDMFLERMNADFGCRLPLKFVEEMRMTIFNKCSILQPSGEILEVIPIIKEKNVPALALIDDPPVDANILFPMSRSYEGKQGNSCNLCGKVFPWYSALARHMKTHNGDLPFHCSICSRRFRESYNLKRHLKGVHRQEKALVELKWQSDVSAIKLQAQNKQLNSKPAIKTKLHQCEHCSFVTKHSWSLQRHKKRIHKKNKVSFAKGSNFDYNLKVPTKTDFNEKDQPHLRPCKVVLTRCDDIILKPGTMNKGTKVKARSSGKPSYKKVTIKGEKLFQCSVCRKTYRDHYKIIAHFRTHTNERPFKCPTCFKAFRYPQNLDVHSRRHLPEKDRPFKCAVCSKAFVAKDRLVDHMNTHSGLEPHACKICHKTFSYRSSLLRHTKRNHR